MENTRNAGKRTILSSMDEVVEMAKRYSLTPEFYEKAATSLKYISKVLNRVTLLGALFLAVVAGVPILVNMIVELITKSQVFTAFAFGGSSLLIVVGVALETFRDIEAQMTMRNYKGFLD